MSISLNISGLQFLRRFQGMLFNLAHIPLFMILVILWLQIIQVYDLPVWKQVLSALVFVSFVGVLYEFIQIMTPGRYPSLSDLGFNYIGSFIGIALYYKLEHCKPGLLRKLVCE
jgi:VanZ family protein